MVQASIVIITTAAGRLQDLSPTDSLDPAVSLWFSYAFISVAVSELLLVLSFGKTTLPAARLSQVRPMVKKGELEAIWRAQARGIAGEEELSWQEKEKILKSPSESSTLLVSFVYPLTTLVIIILGWVMFGLGVGWGVHGSVIAGTTGE